MSITYKGKYIQNFNPSDYPLTNGCFKGKIGQKRKKPAFCNHCNSDINKGDEVITVVYFDGFMMKFVGYTHNDCFPKLEDKLTVKSAPKKLPEFAKDSIMPFGEHKGKKLEDVPASYLLFLYNKNIARGSLKAYIYKNMDFLNAQSSINDKRTKFDKKYYTKRK